MGLKRRKCTLLFSCDELLRSSEYLFVPGCRGRSATSKDQTIMHQNGKDCKRGIPKQELRARMDVVPRGVSKSTSRGLTPLARVRLVTILQC
jgi:hypothetical protein